MKRISILLFFLLLIFCSNVSATEIQYVENSSYEDRIASYDFIHGLARVWRLGESAIVNNRGEIIIDYSANAKEIATNGLIALYGENGKIAFFDSKGKMITNYIYDSFTDVHDKTGEVTVGYINTMYLRDGDGNSDLIPVCKDGKFGYISSKGEVVIPFKYEYAYGFSGGIARVCSGGVLSDYGTYTQGKYGFIREDGTEILPPDSYWIAYDFDNSTGYAYAADGPANPVLIDKWGNFAKMYSKEREALDIKYVLLNPKEFHYGVEDKYGNTIVPVQETEPIIIKDDVFVVGNTLRNKHNEILYKAPEGVKLYDRGDKDFLGLTASDGTSLRLGYIDLNGNVILQPFYDYVNYLGDGLISYKENNEYVIIDKSGNKLWSMMEKPIAAYDGFIAANNEKTLISQIVINPFKEPSVSLNGENHTHNNVPSDWAVEEVKSAISAGYVPQEIQADYTLPIKRREFAHMAVEFLRYELGFSSVEFKNKINNLFDTVEFSDTMDENVLLAARCGIVYGYGDGTFAPDKDISREEAAAMLARVYNLYGNIYSYSNINYDDIAFISSWALSDIKFCVFKGVMKGVSETHFDPKGIYSREQAIATFRRLDADTDWENHNRTAKIRRKMSREIAESELFTNGTVGLVEKYETPYGIVYYTVMGGMMHSPGYDILLIDEKGETYSFTDIVPSEKEYRYVPEIKNIKLSPDKAYISFEVSFDTELINTNGDEIHKAGTYYFEANLEQKKSTFVKFVPQS